MITIREETQDDILAIHDVNYKAFGQEAEAILVDRLRDELLIFKSLVAISGDKIVGNIVFSHLLLATPSGDRKALALAPMAVLPEFQRRKIGTHLVTQGLELCRKSEAVAVLVLGDPMYYKRFGFSAALAERIKSPYSNAGEAWMALELREGDLAGVSATAAYPEVFALVVDEATN
jgi:putative acetyltransferase